MAIPNWFVNGTRVNAPAGGTILCELNPPFTQHMTLEILVHCPVSGIELRHYGVEGNIRQILLCVNRDYVYLTVEPNERLVAHFIGGAADAYVQASLYAWR